MSFKDIDAEWENFIASTHENVLEDEKYINKNSTIDSTYFYDTENDNDNNDNNEIQSSDITNDILSSVQAPTSTEIYISTKTKIAYLSQPIDLHKIFWQIPVIPYEMPQNGVIKKQMKFNSFQPEELEFIQQQLTKEKYFEEYIINHIDNPTGRIKFKDTRKISIGISKKDLVSYRCKKKSAFYNCFVLILRIKMDKVFKEFHVKIFNTGKLEIPGIQSDEMFDCILENVLSILQKYFDTNLHYKDDSNETVLINSNFNCGYFINREILYNILKSKYNIHSIYDPCSYPGIQCKFSYNEDIQLQTGCQISEENKSLYKNIKNISFMIFRTGSVLIVGKCDINVLIVIYEYLKNIFKVEYKNICQQKSNQQLETLPLKDKKKKLRKKTMLMKIGHQESFVCL